MKIRFVILIFLVSFNLNSILSYGQEFVDKQYSGCGLNYELFTSRLSLRADNIGSKFKKDSMPVLYDYQVLQEDRDIVKVLLFASVSGSNTAFSPILIDADSVNHNLTFLEVETGSDPCWSYAEKNFLTYDVTNYFSKNGSYYFGGFPLSSSLTGTDTDGIMVMTIYSDPFEDFIGNLHFSKGVLESNLSVANYIIKGLNVEETTTNAKGFLLAADLQDQGSKISINNSSLYGINKEEFWDLETKNTAVFAGQPTSSFKLSSPNDCAHLLMVGLYYQQPYSTQQPTLNQIGDTLISSSAFGYEWFVGDSLLNSIDSFFVATYPGEYSVVTKDISGCKYESTSIEMTCFENFIPEIYKRGRYLAIDSFYTSIQWFKDDVELIADTDSIYASDSATYYVEVIDTLGCVYKSGMAYFSTVSSVNQFESFEGLKLYPNPSDGELFIELNNGKAIERLEIFSFDGKVIYSNDQIQQSMKISLNSSPGIYLINIHSSEGIIDNTKLIIR